MKYHISKFNPKNYDEHGVYKLKEWDSIYDIGSEFNGKILKEEDYMAIENSYIDAILKIADFFGIKTFRVILLEKNYDKKEFHEKTVACTVHYTNETLAFFDKLVDGICIKAVDLPDLIKLVLREDIWCISVGDTEAFFAIYFGNYLELDIVCPWQISDDLINQIGDSLFINRVISERPRVFEI